MNRLPRSVSLTEHHVAVKHEPERGPLPWRYAVVSGGEVAQIGECASREEAYACALATLRGMVALERIRRIAR